MTDGLPLQRDLFERALTMLSSAALLGGGLGVLRPIRLTLVPRSSRLVRTQVLMAIIGTAVTIIVADSRARGIKTLAKIIKRRDGRDTSVEWEIKNYETGT
jgi:hypothetical protein